MDQTAAPSGVATTPAHWWERADRRYDNGRLLFGGEDMESLSRAVGSPTYVFHGGRVLANLQRLLDALAKQPLTTRVRFAVKANRNLPLLSALRASGKVGIDTCSPREILLARQVGFSERDISFTATAVSPSDIDCLARHPGVWVNCDSLSMMRRLAAASPGREVGFRINPGVGAGYHNDAMLQYGGPVTTKFGIYRDRFEEALDAAVACGLRVGGLHFHIGIGYLNPQLEVWEEALKRSLWFLETARKKGLDIHLINIGGGLGVPLTSDLVNRYFGGQDLMVEVEPGAYLVRDAGALLLQVNTIERKESTLFVGVDGGYNIHIEPSLFHMPLEPVPTVSSTTDQDCHIATIVGNINEAMDILAENVNLPSTLQEGDYLAFLNAGAYGAVIVSDHCLRGVVSEYYIP
jgi:diaminopimelate decarboxylase